jgi:hypothetical protein
MTARLAKGFRPKATFAWRYLAVVSAFSIGGEKRALRVGCGAHIDESCG